MKFEDKILKGISATKTRRRDIFSCSNPFHIKTKVKRKTKRRRRKGERRKGERRVYKCLPLDHKDAKKQMLRLLERPRNWDCVKGPKQKLGNCWFNVMFMSLFVSDYGFTFTKPLRRLMIRGKRGLSGKKNIHPLLRHTFLKFNACVQASIDCNSILSNALLKDTNTIIQDISNVIERKDYTIPKVDEAGNPMDYYAVLFSYLLDTTIYFDQFDWKNENTHMLFTESLSKYYGVIDDKIIIQSDVFVFGYDFTNSNDHKVTSFVNNGRTYILDSAIISNPEHFISFLTIRGKEYAYDGESYKKVMPMKWKHRIQEDKNFYLEEKEDDDEDDIIPYNFAIGLQYYFYFVKGTNVV